MPRFRIRRWQLQGVIALNALALLINLLRQLPLFALVNSIALVFSIAMMIQTDRLWRKLARKCVLRQLAEEGNKTGRELLRNGLETLGEVGALYIFLGKLEEAGIIEGYTDKDAPEVLPGIHLRKYRITSIGIREHAAETIKDLANE